MNNVGLIYLNGFAALVLLLVLGNYRLKLKSICCEEKVFVIFSVMTFVMLINEAVIENLWGQPGGFVHIVLLTLQSVDFCLGIIIPMLWLYYCIFRFYHISAVSRLSRGLVALPAALYIILLAATLPGGGAFEVTQDNEYIRGIAFAVGYVAGYVYIAAAMILIFVKRKALNRGELVPYLMIPLIPVVLGIVEITVISFTGLIWAATALVILDIQMLVLNNRTNIDHLTSLNNRMALDTYVRRTMQEIRGTNTTLGLMMIDVDDFKHINDHYGHVEGDRALKATADILRECFSGKHFIARYGGDEFVAAIKNCGREDMDKYLKALETVRVKQNSAAQRPYEIRLSIGANVFREGDITSLHRLYMKVDELMYQDKNVKKKTAADAE